jgi:hypothetical protein
MVDFSRRGRLPGLTPPALDEPGHAGGSAIAVPLALKSAAD